MAVTAVVFDVGETLVDEGRAKARWEIAGDWSPFTVDDLHPDALPCLNALRSRGVRVGAAGNMRAAHEDFLRDHVDFVGSSERWGVEKPAPAFFARVIAEAGRIPGEIAYVGDRVDNDVRPSLAAGIAAVHIRRGAWAHLEPPPEAISILSLAELPEALL